MFDRQDMVEAPRLKALLTDPGILKIFHFRPRSTSPCSQLRLGVVTGAGLLHQDRLQAGAHLHRPPWSQGPGQRAALASSMSKQQQSSDWAAEKLSDQQKHYAASNILYLHALKAKLNATLQREGRMAAAEACFRSSPSRFLGLDLAWWLRGRQHLRPFRRQRLYDAHRSNPLSQRKRLTLHSCDSSPTRVSQTSCPLPPLPPASAAWTSSPCSALARPLACSAAPSISAVPPTA